MQKIRVGVIGASRGAAYAKGARYLDYVQVTAICDMNHEAADAVCKEHNIKNVYYDMDEMLASDVDAVVIATPIPMHAEHAVKAIRAGKHVLSEVTAATTMDGLNQLVEAVRASDKKYMLAENYCYIRPWTILKNMVADGLFGDIYYAEGDFLMDFQLRPNFPDVQPWRKEIYLNHQGHPYITHSLGPIAQLIGEPIASVTCMGCGHYPDYGLKADNTCVLTMQTNTGKLLRLRHGFVCTRPDIYTYYGFQGTKGAYEGARYAGDRHRVYIKGVCKQEEWRDLEEFAEYLPSMWNKIPKEEQEEGWNGGTLLLLDEFAQCVAEDRPVPIGISQAANWTSCGLLSERSVQRGGAVVEVPSY